MILRERRSVVGRMHPDQIFKALRQSTYYILQKTTGFGVDEEFERDLRTQAARYLKASQEGMALARHVDIVQIGTLGLENRHRYHILRGDIYKRFITKEDGPATDSFGRRGKWIPRGCVIYLDRSTRDYVKIFDDYYCRRGEGRFLQNALDEGLYDFLCPNLSYVVSDESNIIRGYAIRQGRQLTLYEFERYIGGSLRELICDLTKRTGMYFYDLTYHNVIMDGAKVSLIDLESVLPIEWFGKGPEFSLSHLLDIDIGWPIQKKWHSPEWYWKFLMELTADSRSRNL